MVIRRSQDNGQSWGPMILIVDLQTNPNAENEEINSAMNIDMTMIQDQKKQKEFFQFLICFQRFVARMEF
ncbi:hypothetical protein ACTQ54_00845 [Fundicoccus sp. Sow4_H7]|uniref:hypothetical protein n=1 Tax=Fundicoccus sp. Sow4_H7 TaxID=3438784 RepID=UPI003F92B297